MCGMASQRPQLNRRPDHQSTACDGLTYLCSVVVDDLHSV